MDTGQPHPPAGRAFTSGLRPSTVVHGHPPLFIVSTSTGNLLDRGVTQAHGPRPRSTPTRIPESRFERFWKVSAWDLERNGAARRTHGQE